MIYQTSSILALMTVTNNGGPQVDPQDTKTSLESDEEKGINSDG